MKQDFQKFKTARKCKKERNQDPVHTVRKSRNITEQNRSPIFFICGANVVEHYGKRIKILHGCPFEG